MRRWIKEGTTRIVFILKRIVIKVPNFRYQWDHGLKGLIANIQERRTWRWNSGRYEKGTSHLLCPVLWTSWGGWLLIMRRADVDSHIDDVFEMAPYGNIDHADDVYIRYKEHIDAGFGGDDKADSYGYLDGRLVKVDYGSS